MGRGMRKWQPKVGCGLRLRRNPEATEAALQQIQHSLARLVEKGRIDKAAADAAVARISIAESLAQIATADVIIEAIIERLDTKQELFATLDRLANPGRDYRLQYIVPSDYGYCGVLRTP